MRRSQSLSSPRPASLVPLAYPQFCDATNQDKPVSAMISSQVNSRAGTTLTILPGFPNLNLRTR